MEFVQFHSDGDGVRGSAGILVTEAVRARANSAQKNGERFMEPTIEEEDCRRGT